MALPRHVAVIMDGNRRWTRLRGLSAEVGYKIGVRSVRAVIRLCLEYQIPYLTLYALSSENMSSRTREELFFLFNLLVDQLWSGVGSFQEMNVNVTFMGNVASLPGFVQRVLQHVTQCTASYDRLRVKIALNYGGREEIVHATKNIVVSVQQHQLKVADINVASFARHLYDATFPDLDLLIRTGCEGRTRVSNFLLWQIAYAELSFTPVMWPDYGTPDFKEALLAFQRSERLFGV